MRRIISLFILLAILAAAFSYAQDSKVHTITLPSVQVDLKAGEGRETTERYCSICHSTDYITMQPSASRAQWTAVVNKMIKVFDAPVPDEDAKVIISYLSSNYGTGR